MQDRQPAVMAVTIVVFVLASIFVAFRFVSRIGIVHRIGLHDYFMILAWLIDFGFSFSILYATSIGLGLHDSRISSDMLPALNRAEYVITVLYNPALMTLKTSILVFYLTLTRGERVFRWANYATLFVVNAAGVGLTMVNMFQCRPFSAVFRSSPDARASCTDIVTLYLCSAPVNLITDVAIFFLPIPILTRMHLPLKQKIILLVTFGFGVFTAVVDVIRVAYLQNAAASRALAYQNDHHPSDLGSVEYKDFSWYGSFIFMWSAVEVNTGIICACVPSLKPLVARVFPGLIRGVDDTLHVCAARSNPVASPVSPCPMSIPFHKGNFSNSKSGSSVGRPVVTGDPDEDVDMVDFLRAPNIEGGSPIVGSGSSPQNTTTFFDFVNMRQPKSMLQMNNRESIPPVAMGTIIFFMWGFAYGLLDILNAKFQATLSLNAWGSLGLHGAYYGGYLIGPLTVGRFVLKTWGFKATFITGLCIYACGTLIFWPSAVLTSFPAFNVSNFVVGFGLSVLETAANPFIALCGPLENSEVRLNFSQGVQAIGSVISPLLAQQVLFRNVDNAASLVDVQWAYLAVALFDVLLAVVFYYLPIPEASDQGLQELAERRGEVNSTRVGRIPVVWLTFSLGVFSQWCYVGGQEAFSVSFENLVQALSPKYSSNLGPFNYLLIGHTLFAVGRFLTALTQCFLKPRWILLLAYVGMILFSGLCMSIDGSAGVTMGLLLYLFESGAFSTIFAISLRGTAHHTKTAAAVMTTAINGAIIFPFPQIAAAMQQGTPYSFCVTMAMFAFGSIFPLYLNFVPAARKQVDPIPNETLRSPCAQMRRQRHGIVCREKGNPASGGVLSRPRSVIEEPLATVQLQEKTLQITSQSHDTFVEGTPPGGGGIMHDLAPWPNE
ncbi:hypothetical protein Egran_04334 [Elaphomyces granulatus]|uniref:Rhodopsin domain-containing protein n=1 Tax=Elaphomyces granulatus TaxID=519963 RepID=A0A232LUV9_9EURO|nr:hypothetical protein Egran_04334 [Elaphomyces granulatus]